MKSLVSQKEKLFHRYVNGVVGLSLSSNEIVNGLAGLTKTENKLLARLDLLCHAALFPKLRWPVGMEWLDPRNMMPAVKYGWRWSTCYCSEK
jgi:hypothetical protein